MPTRATTKPPTSPKPHKALAFPQVAQTKAKAQAYAMALQQEPAR